MLLAFLCPQCRAWPIRRAFKAVKSVYILVISFMTTNKLINRYATQIRHSWYHVYVLIAFMNEMRLCENNEFDEMRLLRKWKMFSVNAKEKRVYNLFFSSARL